MKTVLVSYDLNNPGQKYGRIHQYLKSFERWLHALESLWFVSTDKSPAEIRDDLKAHGADANDTLLVIDVTGDDWSSWLSRDANEWLQTNMSPSWDPFRR